MLAFCDHFIRRVPARRFTDDVVSLPFARRLGGIDQRGHLPVKRARLAVGIGLVLVGIDDLDLVHIVDQNPAVAPRLAVQVAGRIWLRKLHMQLEIGPLSLGADIAAVARSLPYNRPELSSWRPVPRMLCHFERSFPSKSISASEGGGAPWLNVAPGVTTGGCGRSGSC